MVIMLCMKMEPHTRCLFASLLVFETKVALAGKRSSQGFKAGLETPPMSQ